MEVIYWLLNATSMIAHILGFIALDAIAIALIDWRRMKRYEFDDNDNKTFNTKD
jgi:hypothetical protein